MTVRQINLMLWTLAAVLSVGTVVCAIVGLMSPMDVASDAAGRASRAGDATSPATRESQLSLGDFESIWALKLRKSLSDAPAVAAMESTQPTQAGSVGPFILVGTIGDSLAMIRTAAGGVELKGLGDLANGAKIVAIRPSQVDIEVGGQRMTIAKLREGGGG